MIQRNIPTGTHGRYLVSASAGPGAPMLLGFHGYGENAEIQLGRLEAIVGAEPWIAVSIQGLHRFYDRRSQRVVASWMTREDRELAIADNLGYVGNCIDALGDEFNAPPHAVFAGFSQGVAMAFRAAGHTKCEVAGVIAVGGDIPPELTSAELSRIPSVLLCRGKLDEWYTPAKFAEDQRRLLESAVKVTATEFEAGHEWNEEIAGAASSFLRTVTLPDRSSDS